MNHGASQHLHYVEQRLFGMCSDWLGHPRHTALLTGGLKHGPASRVCDVIDRVIGSYLC